MKVIIPFAKKNRYSVCIRNLNNLVECGLMSRKKIFIIVGVGIGAVILVGTLLFNRERFFPKKEMVKTSDSIVTPTPAEKLLLWEDPAGFSFQYPQGLLMDKHDEDTENYAHIELTNIEHKGSVIIWAKDTTATTIGEWLKNEKTLKGAPSIDTTLGGNEAKKVMVKEPIGKQITATLDEDILIVIEANLEDLEFWQGVNDTIVKSMTFSTTPKDEITGGGGDAREEPLIEADEEESVE